MDPIIAGYQIADFVGSTPTGAVYRAIEERSGRQVALKVLGAMSINRKWLGRVLQSLRSMRPHIGITAPIAFNLEGSPYYIVEPWLGQPTAVGGKGVKWSIPTLENLCGKQTGIDNWTIIYELCDSLAWLHQHGIPHLNITLQSVLESPSEMGRIRIIDVGQGYLPGIHFFEFSGEEYYMSPEYLSDPEIYPLDSIQINTVDVFSFGVAAFRLITGRFPRSEERYTAAKIKRQRRAAAGLPYQSDPAELLAVYRLTPPIEWGSSPGTKWEARRREIIERCLSISPEGRWSDMREVKWELERLEYDCLLEEARSNSLGNRSGPTALARLKSIFSRKVEEPRGENLPIKVFLSHSSKDVQQATAVCEALESRGVGCWIAPRDIPAGQTWAEAIIEALERCKVMVLLLSPHANASKQVAREVAVAADNNLQILPVRLTNTKPSKGLVYYLSAQQWFEAWDGAFDPHVEKICFEVERALRNP